MVSNASIRKLLKEEITKQEVMEEWMKQLMTNMEVLTKHVMGTPTHKMNYVADIDKG